MNSRIPAKPGSIILFLLGLARLKSELPDTKIEFTPATSEEVDRWSNALEQRKKRASRDDPN